MSSTLLAGRVPEGIVLRVVGRGTMAESVAVRAVADANQAAHIVVFDATECEYLDSTFLGCLIGLHKACENSPSRRFVIAAAPDQQMRLFSTSSLDKFFDFVDACPGPVKELVTVDAEKPDRTTLGWHVMRCHERLAECGGSEADSFRTVVDRLRKDLDGESAN